MPARPGTGRRMGSATVRMTKGVEVLEHTMVGLFFSGEEVEGET